ncbi:hypothetical protein OAM56_03985 [Alphaproteobacteria bacterium]|nr:hypothetical protein [Alphaproteobacteria bacterium]
MALPRQCRVCFQKNIPSSSFGRTICVDCEIIEGQKKTFKENERHHKEVEKNLNNQQNTQLNIPKKNTIECPHCSTYIADYATVCPCCGAEKVLVAKARLNKSEFIQGILLIPIIFAALAYWLDSGTLFVIGVILTPFISYFGTKEKEQYEWHR